MVISQQIPIKIGDRIGITDPTNSGVSSATLTYELFLKDCTHKVPKIKYANDRNEGQYLQTIMHMTPFLRTLTCFRLPNYIEKLSFGSSHTSAKSSTSIGLPSCNQTTNSQTRT